VTPLRVLTVDDEPLALRRLQIVLESIEHVEHVGQAESCAAALPLVLARRPNVLLLDIRMRDGSGFDLLDRIADKDLPAVIFVTAFDFYAVQAFDSHAVDYVLKPVEAARLALALERARQTLQARDAEDRIGELRGLVSTLREQIHAEEAARPRLEQEFWIRKAGGGFVRIAAGDIETVAAEDDYVRLRTASREYLMRETVSGLHARLDQERFLRIHRSTLVRVDTIREFRRDASGRLEVITIAGARLPVGRIYAKSLRSQLPIG
jgi:two-component system LytT family response regulator